MKKRSDQVVNLETDLEDVIREQLGEPTRKSVEKALQIALDNTTLETPGHSDRQVEDDPEPEWL